MYFVMEFCILHQNFAIGQGQQMFGKSCTLRVIYILKVLRMTLLFCSHYPLTQSSTGSQKVFPLLIKWYSFFSGILKCFKNGMKDPAMIQKPVNLHYKIIDLYLYDSRVEKTVIRDIEKQANIITVCLVVFQHA